MNILLIGTSSFLIAFSGALVPGPLFTITVAESLRRGAIAGPLVIVGHGLLELAMVGLLVLGITSFLTDPALLAGVCVVGGIMLVIMGIGMIRTGRTASLDLASREDLWRDPARQNLFRSVLAGIVGSVSNPYWTIWWVTVGVGYLVSSLKFGLAGFLAFFVGHILADLLCYSAVSFAVARGKRIMGGGGYRYLLYGCGVFLICFGAWFIASAGSLSA